ncbi:MAG: ImmA/IrrE family metallo-endopeptidase [Lachnospiraceae bacterium]|jgi:Zn-dependent peptidase ImmA (M78 family)|nr:ImmA/IrrE family metallo-endopeptidase [Lachnospiraceae bacterium]MCI1329025.1 ImmA/IrrE family metallo-endopeptidase [Lachnospiraceae bacterium]
MNHSADRIANLADHLVEKYHTRDPEELASCLRITIMERNFKKQNGAYVVEAGNPFIFIKKDLPSYMRKMVITHEIGHDRLHRAEAEGTCFFHEFELFNMAASRMEYEANLMAAQILLPDREILEYIQMGYDTQQIANIMHSDINLVALKNDILIARGHSFRRQDHNSCFLRPE